MKRIFNWQVFLGLALIGLSVSVFFIHYLIFKDAHHIFIYLMGDIGFAFLEVFLVTLILHQLLTWRDKQALFNKLNMVIGAFFSEVGMELLKNICLFDDDTKDLEEKLASCGSWDNKKFLAMNKEISIRKHKLVYERGDIVRLKAFLQQKRDFLLRLLENQNLLEHEAFTNLLWAVFHLTEELEARPDVNDLPDSDKQHLLGDMRRAYGLLIKQWLYYMKHLKSDYPYLFSLAVRTNPFNTKATAIVY
jgi:hypothetical protein